GKAGRPTQRANVSKVEVPINDSARAGLQVRLYPLRRQDQTALFQPWHRLVVLRGGFLQAEFLGVEEKCLVLLGIENLGNIQRTADRAPEILPSIERGLGSKCLAASKLPGKRRGCVHNIEVIARVKCLVAHEVVEVSVPFGGSGLGCYLHRARRRTPELSTVVRREHFHFLDSI